MEKTGGANEAAFTEAAGTQAKMIFSAVQHDFALASRTVFYAMAAVMAVAFVVALIWLPSGKAPELADAGEQSPSSPA
jgi:hypothetical protein